MASTFASIDLPVSPDRVWRLIGGFDSLPDWLPFVTSSELGEGGRVRRLVTGQGDTIVERLETFDDQARTYSYSIVEGPFPVSAYHSTLAVHPADEGECCHVEWSGTFTPDGAGEEEVVALFNRIYTDGLDALKRALGV
ncbi:SRPBCC family protein [Nonomuraea terrae]|uniref:SRPBCC family protein n=1 Tax=Nonomuraea terrae TaxID=2530383 RepID=A0A4R4YLY9_9ACTN|nr:SRPBCC family protein [Nonomuraea terrae]TDD45966.1 SRPBCC family protein [Nonomuraea terrae]